MRRLSSIGPNFARWCSFGRALVSAHASHPEGFFRSLENMRAKEPRALHEMSVRGDCAGGQRRVGASKPLSWG